MISTGSGRMGPSTTAPGVKSLGFGGVIWVSGRTSPAIELVRDEKNRVRPAKSKMSFHASQSISFCGAHPNFSVPTPRGFGWDVRKLDGDDLDTHYRHTLEELEKRLGMPGIIFHKGRTTLRIRPNCGGSSRTITNPMVDPTKDFAVLLTFRKAQQRGRVRHSVRRRVRHQRSLETRRFAYV